MSLKAIKEALTVVAAIKAPGGPIAEIHTKASAEIAALEKAATTVAACGISYPTQSTAVSGAQWQDAAVLLATIAKEAP